MATPVTPNNSFTGTIKEKETHWNDFLNRIFTDLKNKNEDVKIKATKQAHHYVASQSRELSADLFSKLMVDIQKGITNLIAGNSANDKISALMIIDELIDIDYDENENANKISKFGQHIRRILIDYSEGQILLAVPKPLGHLIRTGGTTQTAETVDVATSRAFDALKEDKSDQRRHAGVLILKELAINAPTLFNVHVPNFVVQIWTALNDPSIQIRESAAEAIRACLDVVAERQNNMRSEWYRKLYAEAIKGFTKQGKDTTVFIHGSLLVLGELAVNTGDFMEGHFKDLCDTVLRYRDSKEKVIRKLVVMLLPRIAAINPDAFAKEYLNICITYLMSAMKKDIERQRAFLSLGEIAMAVKSHIKVYLDQYISLIKAGLQPKKKADFEGEALTCLRMLAVAVGPAIRSYMSELLPEMLNGGLTNELTDTLGVLGQHIPAIMPDIQELLLHFLATLLGYKYEDLGNPKLRRSVSVSSLQLKASETDKTEDQEIVALALKTLGSFEFASNTNVKNFDALLKDLLQNCIMGYVSNDNPIIRKEAALTAAKLIGVTKYGPLMSDILDKLLIIGISDRDDSIRRAVLASLDTKFDQLLAQPENLSSLFLVLNDEVFEVRELAITVIGRLTVRNPAFVMPSLRKTLIQLLGDLQFSGDSKNKEQSARLLAHLIRSSHRLISSYVDTIMEVLLPKLKEENPHVASSVLGTLGELSLAGGESMKRYIGILMPVLLENISDQNSSKREVAIRTLGQFATNLGYVILPYFDYPQLMDLLLNQIKTETNPTIRQEIIRVLGLLGGLDPYKYSQLQMKLKGNRQDATGKSQEEPEDSKPVSSTTEKYYPTVAINALVRVMRDPSLTMHHRSVIESLLPILKSLGAKTISFLPQIMPPYLQLMRTADPAFREALFKELAIIVSTVKHGIRDYLDGIFDIIRLHWSSNILEIISLAQDISVEIKEEFKVYLPQLIPPMLKVLHTDTSAKRQATKEVLHALEVFGNTLEDYLHLVIPAVVNLFEQEDPEMEIHKFAIQTLGRLCGHLNFSDYASRIIHPIVRLLDTPMTKDVSKDTQKSQAITELRKEIFETLCALVCQLGSDYAIFIPTVNKVLSKQSISDTRYETLISRLMKNQPLLEDTERKISDSDQTRRKSDSASVPESAATNVITGGKLKVTVVTMRQLWETSQRSTKDDWIEWNRRFSLGLLRESPQPALRNCVALAQDYPPLLRELFNAAFISCWTELDESSQKDLVQNLETALESPSTPPEILTTLLNLAEFMEHEETPIPFSIKLGEKAEKCHAYAKALYYKEVDFMAAPNSDNVEALISLNNHLSQPAAALGILQYAQTHHNVKLKESWYEKLQNWEEALSAYEAKQKGNPGVDHIMGQVRCLHALGEWSNLHQLSADVWDKFEDRAKSAIAPYAAAASWNMAKWESMSKFIEALSESSVDGSFYRAILAINNDQHTSALKYIRDCRDILDTDLTALVGESYNRAYSHIVRVQQLAELEEVINYKESRDYSERKELLKETWKERLLGCQRNVDTWQRILVVRSMVLTPIEDMHVWLKFASACRKSGRTNLAKQTLVTLLGSDPAKIPSAPIPATHPRVTFAYIKHMWATKAQKPALERLRTFAPTLKNDPTLQARTYQKLGDWQLDLETLNEKNIPEIVGSFQKTIEYDPNWYKAWHSWALVNFAIVTHYEKINSPKKNQYIIPSIIGFFRSIALSPNKSLQDTLRLLTLLFKYGNIKEVETSFLENFSSVSIDTWLQVIPQIIARIAAPGASVRHLIHELLSNVGKVHPQALVFPLTVALKSQSPTRVSAAETVIHSMRKHSSLLVDEALMVSNELVRVAILWNEMWFEGLEDASKLHFGESNTEQAINRLKPLIEMLEKGPETLSEAAFLQNCGRDLQEAAEWTNTFKKSGKIVDFNQAWDLYLHIFRRIKAQKSDMEVLDLEYCSPRLLSARNLNLAVPGTYRSGEPVIRLASFYPKLEVLGSKQLPRKLTINGSDGSPYVFLLKGHEDLRQDERVMQLFGLVNALLASEFDTSRHNLSIQRYSVVPLAPNSGLIGWVPHCDTLHALIRAYREPRKIPISQETRILAQFVLGKDYENFCVMQKVEIFKSVLSATDGMDLKKILWLQSPNAEAWLERRTNYTRSLAAMSMVGYVLGLGDRHCSNLMLDRQSGKVIHIDFGDCFEVAMHREKLPERVPFRLTRMLVNAMGVSGIEGNFRTTCQSVMRVLRENKESLMAVLEAFVYDPLISWRLLTPKDENNNKPKAIPIEDADSIHGIMNKSAKASKAVEAESEITEVLNEKAVSIIDRISSKLTGRDFMTGPNAANSTPLDVEKQVQKLIKQATDIENLSQAYPGWSPYW